MHYNSFSIRSLQTGENIRVTFIFADVLDNLNHFLQNFIIPLFNIGFFLFCLRILYCGQFKSIGKNNGNILVLKSFKSFSNKLIFLQGGHNCNFFFFLIIIFFNIYFQGKYFTLVDYFYSYLMQV